MTECYSARCQQDRKIVRREFNKWAKNLLFQIGLETITKHHFDVDVNIFNQKDDERVPLDFNPNQECLFCVNRQEYLAKKKPHSQINDHRHSITETFIDDDENAPLDLSLKSTTNSSPLISSTSRANVKHRPLFDTKSDIPAMYGQEEFDRFMSDMIASQLEFSSQPYLNMNLFPMSPSIPLHYTQPNKKSSSSQDARVAQLAKQMAYERMLQEIDYQRHPSSNKKSKTSLNSTSSVLTESVHVNHILNDVMMRILHEMYEKEQVAAAAIQQPRASRKGELLFVKKQNFNSDEQFNTNMFNHFINNNNNNTNNLSKQHKHNNKVNPSSSSSSTSSVSSSHSSNLQMKNKTKTKANPSTNYVSKVRSSDLINNNSNNNNNNKIIIGLDGKQIRPKRGQYRRYESEQLAKAVAAVLSNEMSVHKAGSFFGVPHSTLEYKVKERNIKTTALSKSKNESSSTASNNENDNASTIQSEINDEDDDKSSKELTIATSCLPQSNSSINHDHQDNIDDENDSDDDDDLDDRTN